MTTRTMVNDSLETAASAEAASDAVPSPPLPPPHIGSPGASVRSTNSRSNKTKRPQRSMRSRSGSPNDDLHPNTIALERMNHNRRSGIIDHTIKEAKESVRRRNESSGGGSTHSTNKSSSNSKPPKRNSNNSMRRSKSKPEFTSNGKLLRSSSTSHQKKPSASGNVIEDILGLTGRLQQQTSRRSAAAATTTTITSTINDVAAATRRRPHHRKSAPAGAGGGDNEVEEGNSKHSSRRSKRPNKSSSTTVIPSRKKIGEEKAKETKRGRKKSKSTTSTPEVTRKAKSLSPNPQAAKSSSSRHEGITTLPKRRKSQEKLSPSFKSEKVKRGRGGSKTAAGRKTKSLSPNPESSFVEWTEALEGNEEKLESKQQHQQPQQQRGRTMQNGKSAAIRNAKSLSPNLESSPRDLASFTGSISISHEDEDDVDIIADVKEKAHHIRSLSPHEVRASSRRYASKDTAKPRSARSLSPHGVRKSSRRYQHRWAHHQQQQENRNHTSSEWQGWASPAYLKDNVSPLSSPGSLNGFSPRSAHTMRNSIQIPWNDEDDGSNNKKSSSREIKDEDFGDDSFQYTLELDTSDEFKVPLTDSMPQQPGRLASMRSMSLNLSDPAMKTTPPFGQDSYAHNLDFYKASASATANNTNNPADTMPSRPNRLASLRTIEMEVSSSSGMNHDNSVVVSIEEEQRKWAQSKTTRQTFTMPSPRPDQLVPPIKANPRIVLCPVTKDPPLSPKPEMVVPAPPPTMRSPRTPRTPRTGGNSARKSMTSPNQSSPKLYKSPRTIGRKEARPSIEVKKKKLEKNEEEHEYWNQSETFSKGSDLDEIIKLGQSSSHHRRQRDRSSERGERSRHRAGQRRMRDIEKDLDPFAHSDHSMNSLPNMKKQLRERKARSLSPHGVRASSKRYSARTPRRPRSPHEDH